MAAEPSRRVVVWPAGRWAGARAGRAARRTTVPTVLDGGLRLLPEGLPASARELAETATLAHGAVWLRYRRH